MARNIVSALALICVGLVQSVYAQPDSEIQRCNESIVSLVGKHFGISDFSFPRHGMYPSAENGGVITAGACKVWPKNTAVTIAAFAYEDEYEANGKSLAVALIDNNKGEIVATYKGAQMDSAGFGVAQDGLRIDTARYDLAKGVRAFGLDITESYNANCGDGGVGPARTLFIQEGNTIRPILENFSTYGWSYVQGGNARCGANDEEVINQYISYSLGISKTQTNGYANLIITASLSYDDGEKPKLGPFTYELRYDGNKYQNNGGGVEFSKWLENAKPDKWKK
jgi:hypothetical protein